MYPNAHFLSSFEPTIVAELGYTGNKAQLMSAPPYVVAFVGGSILLLMHDQDANCDIFSVNDHRSDS